jgi:hypothetical protein
MKNSFQLLCCFLFFLLAACHKDPPAANYNPFPIQLSGKRSVEGITLFWTPLKTNDFVTYRIWRSNTLDSIPDTFLSKPSNDPNGFSTQLVAQLSDFEAASFSDNSVVQFGFGGQTEFYYRMEVQLKGRSVLSRNVKVNLTSNIKIPYSGSGTTRFAINKATQQLYYFTNGTFDVSIFDEKTETISNRQLNTVNTALFPNTIADIQAGNYDGKPELYIGNSSGSLKLFILDANTMIPTQEIALGSTTTSRITTIQTDKNGLFYLTTNDASATLWIIDRKNPTVLNKYTNSLGSRWRYFLSPVTEKLVALETSFPFRVIAIEPDATTKKIKFGNTINLNNTGLINISSLDNPSLLFLDNGNIVVDQIGIGIDAGLTTATAVFDLKNSFGTGFKAQKLGANDFVYMPGANSGNRFLNWGDEGGTIKTVTTLFFPQDIFVINKTAWILTIPNFSSSGSGFLEKLEL